MKKERTIAMVIFVAFQLIRAGSLALTIEPGIGFVSPKTGERVVIFEHTEHGSGGLVWNRPTPVTLNDLNIPRFQEVFSKHSLMLGCGTDASGSESNIRMGDMAPWFWLHNVPDLEGSFRLEAAKGQLFMGGNIEKATEILQNSIDQYQFKFFWKYKLWQASELMEEIASGEWENVEPQDADEVLQPYSITVSN